MSRSDLNVSRWLDAHSDRGAGLKTISATLADVAGDGDHCLVLADIKLQPDTRSRLKVYRGTLLTSDQTLPDLPSCLISFYGDNIEPKIPAVGIACGLDLLIYKNNKPYYKFTVPSLPVASLEREVWTKLSEPGLQEPQRLLEDLKSMTYNSLTPRSKKLLSLKSDEISDFIDQYKNRELKRQSPITCATTLHRTSQEWNAISYPVVATEAGQIYILDPQNFSIVHQAAISSSKLTPSIIRAVGLFDVEFRILVATRECYVCLLRRGWLEGKSILQTSSYIVDMVSVPGDNFIVVGTSDKLLSCYTKRGAKLWSLEMKQPITCLCLVPLKHLSITMVAVGMKGGLVQIYKGRHSVDLVYVPDTPSSLVFGKMGQEDHVLIIITVSGILDIKILKRTADFSVSHGDNAATPIIQNKPLPLPKRSRLFLEQSVRERQNPVEMHQHFQQDLIRLRLNTARSLVQCQSDQSGTGNEKEMVKISAKVLGLGPKFSLILSLENMNSDKPLTDLSLVFHCKPTIYKLSEYILQLPLIPPGLTYKSETKVEEVSADENSNLPNVAATEGQNIKVFCVREDNPQPILAATINMPPTDPTMV